MRHPNNERLDCNIYESIIKSASPTRPPSNEKLDLLRIKSASPTRLPSNEKLDFLGIEDIAKRREPTKPPDNEKLDYNIYESIIKNAEPKRRKARLDEARDICHKQSLLEWSCLWRGNFMTLKRTPI